MMLPASAADKRQMIAYKAEDLLEAVRRKAPRQELKQLAISITNWVNWLEIDEGREPSPPLRSVPAGHCAVE